jgi:hypothetical protein
MQVKTDMRFLDKKEILAEIQYLLNALFLFDWD